MAESPGEAPARRAGAGGVGLGVTVTSRRLFLLDLGAEAVLLLAQFGRELGAEVGGLEDGADFDLGPAVERGTLQPRDRLVHRLDLPQPEAGDQLLGLGERPVD